MILPNGYACILTTMFPNNQVTLFIRERELQPPSLDLGGGIEISTMYNNYFKTKVSKGLIEVGDVTLQARYDPYIYAQMLAIVPEAGGPGGPPPGRLAGTRRRLGQNAQQVVTFPDGTVLVVYGWYDKITPPSHKEGDVPLMEVKIVVSNLDHNGVEAGPVITNAGRLLGLEPRAAA